MYDMIIESIRYGKTTRTVLEFKCPVAAVNVGDALMLSSSVWRIRLYYPDGSNRLLRVWNSE